MYYDVKLLPLICPLYDEAVCTQRLLWLFAHEYPHITHPHNLWPRGSVVRDSDHHKNIEYSHIPYTDSMLFGHICQGYCFNSRATISIQQLVSPVCTYDNIYYTYKLVSDIVQWDIYYWETLWDHLLWTLGTLARCLIFLNHADPLGLESSYHIVSFSGWCDMGMRPMPLYLFQARVHKNGWLE